MELIVDGSNFGCRWTGTGVRGRRRTESGSPTSREKKGRKNRRRAWSSHLAVESSLERRRVVGTPPSSAHARARPEPMHVRVDRSASDPSLGDAPPMARSQFHRRRLCARPELRRPWPARCSSSGDHRPPLAITLRARLHAQLGGRPRCTAYRLALRRRVLLLAPTAAARTPPRASLTVLPGRGQRG
jgi:hypothetical protein